MNDLLELGPARVLVIDDKEVNLRLMRAYLQGGPYEVVTFDSPQAALELVADEPPDLILLDLMMPVLDGFDFVNELRKDEANRAIPIIVVTAMDLTPEDHRRLSGHVEAILRKGGRSADELLREISALVVASSGQ